MIFLQFLDTNQFLVPYSKDLFHICLELENQGHSMTFRVCNLGSKQPHLFSDYVLSKHCISIPHHCIFLLVTVKRIKSLIGILFVAYGYFYYHFWTSQFNTTARIIVKMSPLYFTHLGCKDMWKCLLFFQLFGVYLKCDLLDS